MMRERTQSRMTEAGVDVERVAQTSVLVKIDDFPPDHLHSHPVWPLSRALAAVGFREIQVAGAVDYFDALDETAKGSRFSQLPGIWIDHDDASDTIEADVIVDLTNDPESKAICLRLCKNRPAGLVSTVFGATWLGVASEASPSSTPDGLHHAFGEGTLPLPPVSRIVAGVILQEIFALIGAIDLIARSEGEILYDCANEGRLHGENPRPWPGVNLTDTVVEVVGAGGIGVHVLEGFAPLLGNGCELRVFDPDSVGPENLSLQIAYAQEDVGHPKARAIAGKLNGICDPSLRIRPFVLRYEQRPSDLSPPHLRIVVPDNFAARKYVNDLSIADGIPFVEAGSSPLAAQQRSYFPHGTACLDHRIQNLAGKVATENRAASCSRVPNPTTPGTNMVIAGILGTEALRVLRPDHYGPPCPATIIYDARFPNRFSLAGALPACTHGAKINTNRRT